MQQNCNAKLIKTLKIYLNKKFKNFKTNFVLFYCIKNFSMNLQLKNSNEYLKY